MFPALTRQDAMNIGRRHIESSRQLSFAEPFGQMQVPNFNDLFFCQLRRAYMLTFEVFRMVCASLGNHVGHVIKLLSEEQMVRANARRIVAFVANHFLLRIDASCDHVRYAMRKIQFIPDANLTIAIGRFIRGPYPTAIVFGGYIYFLPKSLQLQVCKYWHFHDVSTNTFVSKNHSEKGEKS